MRLIDHLRAIIALEDAREARAPAGDQPHPDLTRADLDRMLGCGGFRQRLPSRRMAIRQTLAWQDSSGNLHTAEVSFGLSPDGAIREVFCIAAKDGSDMQSLVHDACIAASLALQHGARLADLAGSFGELREEGAEAGRPASVIGALARLGVTIQEELQENAA